MKIFLAGWFGAGNIGDEAILISELLFLRKLIKGVEFYILSFNPERTRNLTANLPEVKRIIRMGSKMKVIKSDILGLISNIRKADLVIIGGGGLFQDIYNHYPIPFFAALAILAKLYRRRLVLFSVGIGPIRTKVGELLCRIVADSANAISVRDSESATLLKRYGSKKNIYITADPVFFLDPQRTAKVDKLVELYGLDIEKPCIGVCVQDLLFWSDEKKRILADILDTLVKQKDARIVFFPFGAYTDSWRRKNGFCPVDVISSRKISKLMKSKCSVFTEELTPQEILAFLINFDLVISMRLHGLILGLRAGLPVIAITYDEETKIKNLMRRIDQENNLFFVSKIEKQNIESRIGSILDNKGAHRNKSKNVLRSMIEPFNKNRELILRN